MTHPRTLVVAMFGVSAVLGVLQAYVRAQHQDSRVVMLISLVAFLPLLFNWCKADAAHRGITPPPGAPLLVAMFALVGVPYYFLKSLPFRQAGFLIGIAAGLYVLMWVTTVALDIVASRVFAS